MSGTIDSTMIPSASARLAVNRFALPIDGPRIAATAIIAAPAITTVRRRAAGNQSRLRRTRCWTFACGMSSNATNRIRTGIAGRMFESHWMSSGM